MDTTSNNPLAGYFRQPAIYIKLPSGGKYWPDGTLNLPVTGEIPVYPMTTKDEITLRTPDALLNGEGVVSVIQSCCPSITNAWDMPSIDVDTALISLRIASYGNSMDISAKCPKCKEEHSYVVDLSQVVAAISTPDYSKIINVNNLVITMRPQPYFSVNKTNAVNFEEQRILQTINADLPDGEKSALFNQHLQRLVDLNLKLMVDSTESILLPDGKLVTDSKFIEEFYNNTDRNTVKTVRSWLEQAAKEAAIKPVAVKCADCEHSFEITLTFDYANFFA